MPNLIIIDVSSTLVDRTTGTNIGDMTSNGGLAGAFDGTTNQAAAACAAKATSGYCGKTYSGAKIVHSVQVHGSNNFGYSTAGAVSMTINLYGKNGTPASATDGTLLGSVTFTNQPDESASRTIISADQGNFFTSVWVHDIPESSFAALLGELVIYELL